MGYYLRLFAKSDSCPALENIASFVGQHSGVRLEVEAKDTAGRWQQLLLAHVAEDWPIATIERDVVCGGSLGDGELAEFQDEIADARPASAAAWLTTYLADVNCIYAIRILSGAARDDGWTVVYGVLDVLKAQAGV